MFDSLRVLGVIVKIQELPPPSSSSLHQGHGKQYVETELCSPQSWYSHRLQTTQVYGCSMLSCARSLLIQITELCTYFGDIWLN